ncbi:metalloregulator ArsR/SmtB family transcription factor [Cellulomonas fimi]|uniref:Helix-turn-helix domain-containing protein n=1 Tax=Cellulomonas fimi TaxID=1708 RepID=A0A7Y0QHA2_CELFI|nr:helix-turn-helix domain-containing protein [Cellulomonas fimi]NMR18962.1 helix-turn-helix domain-containing protein [Cellulomonas fimi]
MNHDPVDADVERPGTGSRLRVLAVLRSSPKGWHVEEVARHTGLHPNTVRFHLERLASDGLASRHVLRSGVPGRPRLAYTADAVPDAGIARRHFGQLADVLAQVVARTSPEPAAVAIEAGRSWGLSRDAGPEQAANGADAIARLTAVLVEAGFEPEVCADEDEGHVVILQRHCPFLEVARAHPDVVCSVHLGLMRGVLETMAAPVSADRLVPFASPAGCEAHLTAAGATRTDD